MFWVVGLNGLWVWGSLRIGFGIRLRFQKVWIGFIGFQNWAEGFRYWAWGIWD